MTTDAANAALAGGALRAAQALAEASPFLACGLVVAAVFRRLVGHPGTRRLFGADPGTHAKTGLLRAWGVGMLLPVDALGVLPVVRELRKAGVPGGTVLAFALSAPLFNPLSLLFGLTLNNPLTVLAFGAGSLVVVTAAGWAWDRLFPDTAAPEDPPPGPVPQGVGRLLAVAVAGCREAGGGAVPPVLAALLGPLLLGILLPQGLLGTAVNGEEVAAPLVTAAVAVPAYASPMAAMGTVGSMFQHGNSVGAAFAMLVLGAGTTLGLVLWAWRSYGVVPTAAMLGAVVAVTLALSYGIDRPLRADGAEEGGHTHAFDRYTAPFPVTQSAPWAAAWGELAGGRGDAGGVAVHERFALLGLAAAVLAGLALNLADPRRRLEARLERPPAGGDAPAGRYDVRVPGPVLGGVVLAGLAAVSVVGCFAYYPPPAECFGQLFVMQGEALSAANSGDRGRAEEFLPVCEDWADRAHVGYVLRHGPAGEFRALRRQIYRDRLEEVEHGLAHHAGPAATEADAKLRREMVGRVSRTYARLKAAYTAP